MNKNGMMMTFGFYSRWFFFSLLRGPSLIWSNVSLVLLCVTTVLHIII